MTAEPAFLAVRPPEGVHLPLAPTEELGEGIVVIDGESRIRYANPAMTHIFGAEGIETVPGTRSPACRTRGPGGDRPAGGVPSPHAVSPLPPLPGAGRRPEADSRGERRTPDPTEGGRA